MPWRSMAEVWPPRDGLYLQADAEQAKQTGGMVALYPRKGDAARLVIPGGEPLEDLHVTLAYLGEDVSGIDADPLTYAVSHLADLFPVLSGRIMGYAVFNPDGGDDGDKDPCAVYLVGDSEQLPDLHDHVDSVMDGVAGVPEQHKPWIPHITAGYGLDLGSLHYTGPVIFDRLGVALGPDSYHFPLQGG